MHFVYFVCLVKIFTYCLLTFESKARHPRIPNQDFPRIPNRHSRPSCLNCSVKEILRSNIHTLLLGSMYFCSWLIQLNRSYKYHGKITRTGISTSNDHISKSVALREKLKKINCHYFGSRQVVPKFSTVRFFCHFWPIFGHFWTFFGCLRWAILSQICPWDWLTFNMYIKNEHVHVPFVNLIFGNFA